MTIHADQQAAHLGHVISLYTIDATGIGGQLHRFVAGRWQGDPVVWGGDTYTATPIEVAGIEYGGEGPVARPTLTLSRIDESVVSAILATNHWRGACFTRVRTLARYLDGEPGADSSRHWPADVYRVERRQKADRNNIVFELSSPLDFDDKQLPGRQVLRDICAWQYRRWDAGANQFVYAHAEVACPYRGSGYFDADDNAVAQAQDKCSQRLSGCLARYPDRVVPFGGFVGVGRLRRS